MYIHSSYTYIHLASLRCSLPLMLLLLLLLRTILFFFLLPSRSLLRALCVSAVLRSSALLHRTQMRGGDATARAATPAAPTAAHGMSIIAAVAPARCIYERHKLRNRKLHLLPFARSTVTAADHVHHCCYWWRWRGWCCCGCIRRACKIFVWLQ